MARYAGRLPSGGWDDSIPVLQSSGEVWGDGREVLCAWSGVICRSVEVPNLSDKVLYFAHKVVEVADKVLTKAHKVPSLLEKVLTFMDKVWQVW